VTNIDLVGTPFTSNKPYLFRAIYDWVLDNEGTPYLLVDATQIGVQVPVEHVKDGQIILNASPNAIQSWCSDNTAISFSARFSGRAQQIYIPMNALLAIYAQENSLGMAFPEAMEETHSQQENGEISMVQKEQKSNSESLDKKKTSKPSHLKIIK